MHTANAFLLPVLAFMAPTLAFISVNRVICTVPQMWRSLCLAGALGLLCGAAALYWNLGEMVLCGISLAVFLLLSERMFTELMPRISMRCGVAAAILAGGMALAWLSPLLLTLLLLAHMALSAKDLRRNWNAKPNYGQLPFRYFECASALKGRDAGKARCRLQKTPNIYFLFLESIHSPEALRDIYGCDDFGLSGYLRDKDFTIYPNAFSSNTHTVASLFSIFHMMPRYWLTGDKLYIPESFSVLKQNGYQIAAFDASPYVFYDYIQYMDYINFDIQHYVKKLYQLFCPFFMQSSFARRIIGGKDIYMTSIKFDEIYADVAKYLTNHQNSKKCMIIRFGAAHTPPNDSFEKLSEKYEWWDKHYTGLYKQSVERIRATVDLILESDPQACILMAGDHGATRFRGAGGVDDSNANEEIRGRGLTPELVTRDLCDVLVACRCPAVQGPVLREPIAHANFFRDVFIGLGCPPDALSPACAPMTLFFRPCDVQIIARDGAPLPAWEALPPETAYEMMARCTLNAPDRAANHLALARYCQCFGNTAAASQILEKVYSHFPNDAEAGDAWFQELLRQGRTREAARVLEPLLRQDGTPDRRYGRIWMHLLEGDKQTARSLRAGLDNRIKLSRPQKARLDIYGALLERDLDTALHAVSQVKYRSSSLDDDFRHVCAYIAVKGRDLDLAARILNSMGDSFASQVKAKMTRASFHLESCDWEQREQDVRTAMELAGLTPIALHLYLAGTLEMQGQTLEAEKVLLTVLQTQATPSLLEQLGLFFLRHSFGDLPKETCILLKQKASNAMEHYTTFLASAALLDKRHYAKHYGKLLRNMPPVYHFCHFGLLLALDPNADLDFGWCMASSPRHAILGAWPIADFMQHADWMPSLFFRPAAYAARHEDCRNAGVHPLIYKQQTKNN